MFLSLVPKRGSGFWIALKIMPPQSHAMEALISQEIRTHQPHLCNCSALQFKDCQPYEYIATNNIE